MKKILFVLLAFLVSNSVFSQREFTMNEGDSVITMKRYVFMLLEEGENRNQDSISAANIQKGHMEHLDKLASSGKLVMAGPFEKGGKYRGLLIFDTETSEEAEHLERDDPAVKSGRLKMTTFYWWTAKGTQLN